MAKISNGASGPKYDVKVDSSHRIWSRAVSEPEQAEQASLGLAYSVTGGLTTLTTANESAMWWFRNDEDRDIVVSRFISTARNSAGGTTNHALVNIKFGVTGISGGTANKVVANNTNAGSSNVFDFTGTIGQEGASLTGGSLFGSFAVPLQDTKSSPAFIVIPQGSSIGISVTPPAGNTSLSIGVSMSCHLAPV